MLPGLFDHYLNKQDDLGSAVDTNAAIQYRAATAIAGQPRVHSYINRYLQSPQSAGFSIKYHIKLYHIIKCSTFDLLD